MNEHDSIRIADSFPVDVTRGTHAMVAKGYAEWEKRRGIIVNAHLSSGARRAHNRLRKLAGQANNLPAA